MRYILEDLLKIRETRVDTAKAEVKTKEYRYEQAVKKVEQKKKELQDYHIWRIQKESALYEGIKNKLVRLKDLDALRQHIALLRERELALKKAIIEAEKEKEETLLELNKSKEQLRQAIKEHEKILEHKKRWLEDIKKEMERKQEIELEEFKAKIAYYSEEEVGD